MKLAEAKEIVSYIIDWQFMCQGVKGRNEMKLDKDFKKYSLVDLIKANALVTQNNERTRKTAAYHQSKGHKVKPYSIQLQVADRLIAAVYVAMSFPANGEAVAVLNDVGVGCVVMEYEDN